jgi:hypothetical protein
MCQERNSEEMNRVEEIFFNRESVEEVYQKILWQTFNACSLMNTSEGIREIAMKERLRFAHYLLDKIREEFDISVKVKGSKTLSGR